MTEGTTPIHAKESLNILRAQPTINKINLSDSIIYYDSVVLIVDDVPFNHIALKSIFKGLNIKIDSAYDGRQALNKVIQKK